MALTIFLIKRWSCSIRLFRYLFYLIMIGLNRVNPALKLSTAFLFRPLLSIVTLIAQAYLVIAFLKNLRATCISRRVLNKKSIFLP